MSGEGDATLRMIGGPERVKFPNSTGHGAVAEAFAFAPPEIPKPAQIGISAGLLARQFVRQQSAHAQQSRLESERRQFGLWGSNARTQFGQPLHGPDIVFVAKGAQPAFPESLFPACLPSASLE